MDTAEDFESDEHRIRFLRQIIPPDDVYEFIDIALQMASVFCYHYGDTVKDLCMAYRYVNKSYDNLMNIRNKFLENERTPIDVLKYHLN